MDIDDNDNYSDSDNLQLISVTYINEMPTTYIHISLHPGHNYCVLYGVRLGECTRTTMIALSRFYKKNQSTRPIVFFSQNTFHETSLN